MSESKSEFPGKCVTYLGRILGGWIEVLNYLIFGIRSVTTAAGTTVGGREGVVQFTVSTTQTYTLPQGQKGRLLILKNASSGTVTVNRLGTDVIDAAGTTFSLTTYKAQILLGTGSGWLTLTPSVDFTASLTCAGAATVGSTLGVTGLITAAAGVNAADVASVVNQTTLTDNTTLDATHSGQVVKIATDAKVITLPATVAGMTFTVMNSGADGNNVVTISPNAADKIIGAGAAGANDKDIINTKATAKKGDFITLVGDGADGWYISAMKGTWAREA